MNSYLCVFIVDKNNNIKTEHNNSFMLTCVVTQWMKSSNDNKKHCLKDIQISKYKILYYNALIAFLRNKYFNILVTKYLPN